jgi:folate-binding protein YgfZ
MQDTSATTVPISQDPISQDVDQAAPVSAPTALAQALGGTPASLQEFAGALSFPVFSVLSQELAALVEGAGAFDLGYRGQIAVGSADRVRWLNGMLTNNIQDLSEGTGNYSFVLNAQGRILGDCDAYQLADHLLLITDRSQIPALTAHFDHFIIMDDVVLEDISSTRTALGLAGPLAPQLLAALGITLPASTPGSHWLMQTRICGVPVQLTAQLTGGHAGQSPRFELWCANESVRMLWDVLLAAGAIPCGIRAAEALRVLDATPRYGVDLGERYLPQETSQTRALHFAKGCYLGQEIVERIRSRGAVHRRLALFTLSTEPAALPLELTAAGESAVAGRITSTAFYNGTSYGLGVARTEAVVRSEADGNTDRRPTLDYPGGTATLVTHPPLARTASQSS